MHLPKFLKEIFQDTDGGASMKRFAFFLFCVFYIAVTATVLFHGVDATLVGFAGQVLDKTKEIITWLGLYILGDKAPAAIAAFTGKPGTEHTETTEVTDKVTGG